MHKNYYIFELCYHLWREIEKLSHCERQQNKKSEIYSSLCNSQRILDPCLKNTNTSLHLICCQTLKGVSLFAVYPQHICE